MYYQIEFTGGISYQPTFGGTLRDESHPLAETSGFFVQTRPKTVEASEHRFMEITPSHGKPIFGAVVNNS